MKSCKMVMTKHLFCMIQVYDPEDCLSQRLLALNVSDSPFIPTFTRNYTFLSCPFQNAGSDFVTVECLSNSTNFVSAIPSVNLPNPLPYSCYVGFQSQLQGRTATRQPWWQCIDISRTGNSEGGGLDESTGLIESYEKLVVGESRWTNSWTEQWMLLDMLIGV
ncbi:hypothetical protein VNO78_25110 [Psophocarpus tetragonolobus]|uniref:RING-type E3 ubiquitin transferase n=1 Tax=Psophocarpus tetragonolobus TaxID=3891 RepID=A0AAN9S738_PSOTE